jgi:SAM-dependent methyltransferase
MRLSSWDLGAKSLRTNPQVFRSDSLTSLRARVSGAGNPSVDPLSSMADTPQLLELNRSGFDLYRYQSRCFAIPASEPFLIDSFRRGTYRASSFAHTIDDLRQQVDRMAASPKPSVLFVVNVRPSACADYLKRIVARDITLLAVSESTQFPPALEIIRLPGTPGVGAFDPDGMPAEFLELLRARRFDLVVIPYEGREWWADNQLERLAAAVSNQVSIMFADGQTRTYRGEDVRRIQYNKAYLASMFQFMPTLRGRNVLEVGSSDGLACDLLLTEQPAHITGVDVVDIVGCGYRHPTISYKRIHGTTLPFDGDSFDAAVSIATMEHVGEPFDLIKEMVRVTAPGGYVYIQAGPLYFSPYGHHMFGYFDDYPWIHLRLSVEEIIAEGKRRGLDARLMIERGESTEAYVRSMLDVHHINGKTLADYRIDEVERTLPVRRVLFRPSYEGTSQVTPEILGEMHPVSQEDLTAHGFELILQKVAVPA